MFNNPKISNNQPQSLQTTQNKILYLDKALFSTLKKILDIFEYKNPDNLNINLINREVKVCYRLLQDEALRNNLHNWEDYERLLNDLNLDIDLTPLYDELNQFNISILNKTPFLNINKIYDFALKKLMLLNVVLPARFKNIDTPDIQNLVEKLNYFLETDSFNEKAQNLYNFLSFLLNASIKQLYNSDFSKNIPINLHSLFLALDNFKYNKDFLYKFISSKNFIKPSFSQADMYLFNEVLKAYSTFSRLQTNEKILIIPNGNYCLTVNLLKKIMDMPQLKEFCLQLPFDIALTWLYNLNPDEKINAFNQDSKLLIEFLDMKGFSKLTEKLLHLQISYFNFFSAEVIQTHNAYKELLDWLINSSEISQKHFNHIIEFFIKIYSSKIIPDLYTTPTISNYLKEYLCSLDQAKYLALINQMRFEQGFTFNFAKFLDEVFGSCNIEKINCLFESSSFVIENFLMNYNHLITLDLDSHEMIFSGFIDLFENHKIPAHIIRAVFDWIDSLPDLILSNEFIEKFSLMLTDQFQWNALGLIPQHILTVELALKIFSHLEGDFTHLSPNEKLNYLKNYNIEENDFNPSLFNSLPAEIKYQIGSFLNKNDLSSLIQTTKEHATLFNDALTNKHNIISLRKILTFFFKNYPWNEKENITQSIANIDIPNLSKEIQQPVLEILSIFNSKNPSIQDQKNALSVISHLLLNKELSCFSENIDFISNPFEINQLLQRIFTHYFEIKTEHDIDFVTGLSYEILKLIDHIDITFSQDLMDKVIKKYHYTFGVLLFHNKSINSKEEGLMFLKEINKGKFLNFNLLRRMMELPIYCDDKVTNAYLKITGEHTNIECTKKFLENKKSLQIILKQEFPEDFEWRLNYIKEISSEFDNLSINNLEEIISFLSIKPDWIKNHLDFLFNLSQERFFSLLLSKKAPSLGLKNISKEKMISFVKEFAKDQGYSHVLYMINKNLKLGIKPQQFFKFAIHQMTSFPDFFKDFKALNPKNVKIDFEDIKNLFKVYCLNKSNRDSFLAPHLDFLISFVNLEDSQIIKLFKIAFKALKLSNLKSLQKSSIFTKVARKNDELFIALIEECLKDPSQLVYFKKEFSVIEELIGSENAHRIKQKFAPTKRKSRPAAIKKEPASKKRKGK